MAVPAASAQVAQQAVQQKLPEAGAQQQQQQVKQESSKFDAALANKTAGAGQVSQVGQVDQVRHAEKVYQTQGASKTIRAEKADSTKKVQGAVGKESSQGTGATSRNMLTQLVEELEKGQGKLDKLIEMGSKGKEFSNTELLALQAGMYKYSQELDLTSKVVEKATNGLKDTLKTQV